MALLKPNRLFDYIYIIIGIPFLFLSLTTSGSFTQEKTILLSLLGVVCLIEILKIKKINSKIFLYIIIFITYFMCSLFLVGIPSGYEFSFVKDFSLLQYFLITPALVLVIYTSFSKFNYRVEFLIKILRILTLILVIIDVIRILSLKLMIPNVGIIDNFVTVSNDSLTEIIFRVSNESSLMFLLPIYIVEFFNSNKHNIKRTDSFILLFGIIYALLSGRKMLEIVAALALIVGGFLIFKKNKEKLVVTKINLNYLIVFILVIIVVVIVLNNVSSYLNIENIWEQIYSTIKRGLSSSSYGVTKRAENTKALFELWLQSPIIGNGLNSYSLGSLASMTSKWSYEVVYIALLAQTGIVGCLIFAFGIYYMLRKLWRKYRNTYNSLYISFFIGFASFILCGASNPMVYLLWPWTITLIISNYNIEQYDSKNTINKSNDIK